MPRPLATRATLALLAAAACAAPPRAAPLRPMSTPTLVGAVPRHADLLTAAELVPRDTRSLLDVAAARWPGLVRGPLPRGNGDRPWTPPTLQPADRFGVYDAYGAFLGGPEYLAAVSTSDVRQLRRLTDTEEHAAFGRRHPAGAVVITWAGTTMR